MSLVARQVTGQKDERRFDWQEPQCKKHLCDSWSFRVCCWGFEHMRCPMCAILKALMLTFATQAGAECDNTCF
jgi:hypothetical protein